MYAVRRTADVNTFPLKVSTAHIHVTSCKFQLNMQARSGRLSTQLIQISTRFEVLWKASCHGMSLLLPAVLGQPDQDTNDPQCSTELDVPPPAPPYPLDSLLLFSCEAFSQHQKLKVTVNCTQYQFQECCMIERVSKERKSSLKHDTIIRSETKSTTDVEAQAGCVMILNKSKKKISGKLPSTSFQQSHRPTQHMSAICCKIAATAGTQQHSRHGLHNLHRRHCLSTTATKSLLLRLLGYNRHWLRFEIYAPGQQAAACCHAECSTKIHPASGWQWLWFVG